MNRWENSSYWARTFSPLLQMGIVRVARFDLTAFQVANSFTVPINLLPAVQGYAYVAVNALGLKNEATAFTGPQTANILYGNSAGTGTGIIFDPSFFSAATTLAELVIAMGANRLVTTPLGTNNDVGSTGLVFRGQVANMGAGSSCTFVLLYYLWPTLSNLVGGPSSVVS